MYIHTYISKYKHFDVSCVSFGLHEMPLDIMKQVLVEMCRVTKKQGKVIIVDYGLPNNKIFKKIVYYFVKIYESKYYSDFIRLDFRKILKEMNLGIEKDVSILAGAGRMLSCKKIRG